MDRPRMLRLLRIAFSALCGIVCLLLILLWVRSYQSSDALLGLKRNTGFGVTLVSENRQLIAASNAPISSLHQISQWSLRSLATSTKQRPIKSRFGFGHVASNREVGFAVPHWFAAILFGTLAAISWPIWRFSVRALLITTTLAAMMLGAIIFAIR